MVIITAVGPDRPGMAHAVAAELMQLGCNIEDTTMTRLCGEFAMILVVTPPAGTGAADVAGALSRLDASHNLFVNCRDIPGEAAPAADLQRYIVSAYGPDRTGLVERLTRTLAQHRVNITDLQTRVASAGAVYVMIFEVELPADCEPDSLLASLQESAQEIGVEVSLHPLEEDTL